MEKLKISPQEHDHQHSPNNNDGDSDGDIEDEDDDDDVDHDDMPVSDTTWMINYYSIAQKNEQNRQCSIT
jgi:hypothetical protein